MFYVSYDCRFFFFFNFAKSLLCFIDEITASFRRFGPLVVDWPHKAESKSYFPPKGNGLKMSPGLSEASPVEGILTSLEVDPLSLSKITLVSLCVNFTWRGFPGSALCLMTLALLAVRFYNFI